MASTVQASSKKRKPSIAHHPSRLLPPRVHQAAFFFPRVVLVTSTTSLKQPHPAPTSTQEEEEALVALAMAESGGGSNTAEEEDASSSKQQGVLDVSDKKMLRPKELKRWRLFNVELDGQGTPEDILKDKPFQLLHNFVVYRGHSGQVMAWPESKPTIKPYHGSKLRVEGELKRMASYKSGRKEEVSMRVVAGVRRFAVDVRRGEQRGIWIEGKDVWFLLQAPRPAFAPLMRCYKTWYEKVSVRQSRGRWRAWCGEGRAWGKALLLLHASTSMSECISPRPFPPFVKPAGS